jgi:hypothetical protein
MNEDGIEILDAEDLARRNKELAWELQDFRMRFYDQLCAEVQKHTRALRPDTVIRQRGDNTQEVLEIIEVRGNVIYVR